MIISNLLDGFKPLKASLFKNETLALRFVAFFVATLSAGLLISVAVTMLFVFVAIVMAIIPNISHNHKGRFVKNT